MNALNVKINGQVNFSMTAAMHIPIPFSFASIDDPTSLHQIVLKRKLIIPHAITNFGNLSESSITENSNDTQKSSLIDTETGQLNALGKRSRSNFYGQRVVAEISLVSVLSEDFARCNNTKFNEIQVRLKFFTKMFDFNFDEIYHYNQFILVFIISIKYFYLVA